MGRIKTLESEQRKHTAAHAQWGRTWHTWKELSELTNHDEQRRRVLHFTNTSGSDYGFRHPRPETVSNAHIAKEGTDLHCLMGMIERGYGSDNITAAEACQMWLAKHPTEPTGEDAWSRHYALRLAYENQMLEAQGGRLAAVEMIPGGFIGGRQIQKVNKSSATGRVVSVSVWGTKTGFTKESGYTKQATRPVLCNIDTERLAVDAYRPPTPEELEAFEAAKKEAKKAAPKKDPCPLINPTDEDAQRLQDALNERNGDEWRQRNSYRGAKEYQRQTVIRITQAAYSAASGGTYARARTSTLHRDTQPGERSSNMYSSAAAEREKQRGPALCKFRMTSGEGDFYNTPRVIIISDTAQKPFPATVWKAQAEAVAPIAEEVEEAEEAPSTLQTFTQAALF